MSSIILTASSSRKPSPCHDPYDQRYHHLYPQAHPEENLHHHLMDTLPALERDEYIDLALHKLSIEHFDSKATKAAIMEIDMEPLASRQQLDGIIRASVLKQTKKLQNKIQTLKAGLAKAKPAAKTW
jgi:hypothetical protein